MLLNTIVLGKVNASFFMEAFEIAFCVVILVAMNVFFEKTNCFIVIDMIHDISNISLV
jgi:hypothetical protein